MNNVIQGRPNTLTEALEIFDQSVKKNPDKRVTLYINAYTEKHYEPPKPFTHTMSKENAKSLLILLEENTFGSEWSNQLMCEIQTYLEQ